MEQNNISLGNPLAGKPSPSQQEIDEHFMLRCMQLAKNGRQNAKPNPMVGAVIVSEDGRILGAIMCAVARVMPRSMPLHRSSPRTSICWQELQSM